MLFSAGLRAHTGEISFISKANALDFRTAKVTRHGLKHVK